MTVDSHKASRSAVAQLDLMTEPDQLPRPVVRRGASLDADQTGRQLLEKRQQLTAPQLPADDNVTSAIYAVNLENVLREIEGRSW